MIRFLALSPNVTADHLGLLPMFFDEEDERPAREQLDANYQHGGGWRPGTKWTLDHKTMALHYPGDPALHPLAIGHLREEIIVVYEYGVVAIVQNNWTFEAARVD